jgi:hypothetical protein
LIGVCEGVADIIRIWQGKVEIDLSLVTRFDGDNNTGIEALVGEDFTTYPNLVCAYFPDWELGTSEQIPNFVFEVSTTNQPLGLALATHTDGNRLDNDSEITINHSTNGVSLSCDFHLNSGRYLISQKADADNEPMLIFDNKGNNVPIHFDNTGSNDWFFTLSIDAAVFSKDGQYVYAIEKRSGALVNVLWKWNSYTGELIWRHIPGYGASDALETDSAGNLYRLIASSGAPFDDHLEQLDGDDGSLLATWHNAVSNDDLFIDETMLSSDGVLRSGKMLCCGHDPHNPTRDVALADLADVNDVLTASVSPNTARAGVILNEFIYVVNATKIFKFDNTLTEVDSVAFVGIDGPMHIAIAPGNLLHVTGEVGALVPVVLVYDTDLVLIDTLSPRNADFPAIVWEQTDFPEAIYLYKSGITGGDVNPVDIIEDM